MDSISGRKGVHFMNWAKTYSCIPELFFEPKDLQELKQVLALARFNNRTVKVVGNHHSPSDIACTDDYMISLKYMNKVLEIDVEKKIAKVEGGILISRLNKVLNDNGLGLSVLGSVSDITLAGAISTGTHGTGKEFTILSGYVLQLDLMTADGTVHTLSMEKEAEIFLAAGVALGALGIITSITVQCEPSFRLHEIKYGMKLYDMLENLRIHLESSDHFRAMWYPHTDDCLVFHLSRTSKPIERKSSWFWDYFIGFFMLQFLYWLSSFFSSMVPWINQVYYRHVHSARTEAVDQSDRLFNFNCLFQQYVMEFAIPIEETAVALYRLKAWVENNFCAHLPVEIRFAKADNFYLSPCYKRDSCYINIVMYRPFSKKISYEKYWNAYEDIMLTANGRPHWAKDYVVSPQQLQKSYPCFDKFLQIRKSLDPDGMFLNKNLRKAFDLNS